MSAANRPGPVAAVLGVLGRFPERNIHSAAVAVSGGGDSVALLLATTRCGAHHGFAVDAITVDHGLRTGAQAEIDFVAELCASLGARHHILRVTDAAPQTGIPAWARAQRYAALSDWARTHHPKVIMVGHTADDVAETLLMRLARGTGLRGLSEMPREWQAGPVQFSRPFLSLSRQMLRDWLRAEGVGWIEDPTNDDLAFERPRVRAALAALAPLGIDSAAMAASARHLRAAQGALDQATLVLYRNAVTVDSAGDAFVDLAASEAMGPELRRLLLVALIGWIGQADAAPRRAEQEVLLRTFSGPTAPARRLTLGGCLITGDGKGALRIGREPARVPAVRIAASVPPSNDMPHLYDGRWDVLDHGHGRGDEGIGPLGEAGLALCPDWRQTGLAREALIASPAVWRGTHLVAAPVAWPGSAWTARIVADFPSWLLSH